MKKSAGILAALAAVAAVPVAAAVYLLVMMTVMFSGSASASPCFPSSDSATAAPVAAVDGKVPAGPVAGYGKEQLANAAQIVAAASAMGLGSRAQVVGVMTAMGESGLVNIHHGDGAINPNGTVADSIGLFQQQSNWGTVAQRMDPRESATLFFTALVKVAGWKDLQPTIAAHRVQGNADPYHYEKYFTPATKVVAAVTGLPLSTLGDAGSCQVGSAGGYTPAAGTAPGPWGGWQNGRIPENQLAHIPWAGQYELRPDAEQALARMDQAFVAEFHFHIPINDGYRSYQQQVQAKQEYGAGAAGPGTSNHGWGLAIDIGTQTHAAIGYDSPIYQWLTVHAAAYGWRHPAWAQPGGVGPHEAWHWEYWGVGK